jgi:hypothetical protein
LPGIYTFGADLADALLMAKDAIEMWLWDAENKKEHIPQASNQTEIGQRRESPDEFISLVAADTDEYRKQYDSRAVKKTLSIPAWLNYQAEQANAPFSQILPQGLKQYLNIV